MFKKRTAFATNTELLNQRAINKIVLLNEKPMTIIEKKAAAVCGHEAINPIMQAKIYNNLQSINQILESAAVQLDQANAALGIIYDPEDSDSLADLLSNQFVRAQILEFMQTVPELVPTDRKHDYADIQITITKKPLVLTLTPEPILDQHREYEMLESNWVKPSILSEFEYLCFNNRTQFRYMGSTNFATYMYQNILHYLQLDETNMVDALTTPCNENTSSDEPWQQRLAQLILRINFNSALVEQAFYENSIQYRNTKFDTSFVPKYDVRALEPQQPINYTNLNDMDLITYHETLDIRSVQAIPTNKIAIFLTFPFKSGHLVKPCGKIVYLNLETFTNRRSVRVLMQDLCNIHDIETAVENAARLLPLDYVVWHAANAQNIKSQALALLVLRRLIGDTVTIDGHRVELADELRILSWLEITCSARNIAIPPSYRAIPKSLIDNAINMIRDIAASCCSKRGAAFLCSTYGIPEMLMGNVYAELKTPAEKYIFFTLLLQEYPVQMYDDLRCQLTGVEFGQSNIDLRDTYEPFHREYVNSCVGDRMQLYSEPLLRPDEVNSDVVLCNPVKCFESYEYMDDQLNKLVRNEPIPMNQSQLANFIALMLL